MPIDLYRAGYVSPKRAKAQGKRALGQAAGSVAQSLVDMYKNNRLKEGHIDRLLDEISYNLLGEAKTTAMKVTGTEKGTPLTTGEDTDEEEQGDE